MADPYRWLEDGDSAETTKWSVQQDALMSRERSTWVDRSKWRARVAELSDVGLVTPPIWRGRWHFFTRHSPGKEHPVLLAVDAQGTEHELLDPQTYDPAGATALDGWSVSVSGRLLAHRTSADGSEDSVLRVMRVPGERDLGIAIDRTAFSSVAWLADDTGFYYTRRLAAADVPRAESQFHRRVFLHRLGTDPASDRQIFGEHAPKTSFHFATSSPDGRWLQISTREGGASHNCLYLADLGQGEADEPRLRPVQEHVDGQSRLLCPRSDGPLGDRLFILTDLHAPRGRLCVVYPPRVEHLAWRDLIPEDPESVISDVAIMDGPVLGRPLLLVSRVRHAVAEVFVHDAETGEKLREVLLPSLGSVTDLTTRPDGGHEAWFSYSDFSTPCRVYRYDACQDSAGIWAESPGPGPAPGTVTRQVSYRSADGTAVHMFVTSPQALPADRAHPTILRGYGGFGVSWVPGYDPGLAAWVEAGGVYAIANIRGGGEEGKEWHQAGMLGNKQNSFDDFYAAAESLITAGWTARENLAILGYSNGGLLVGAALTQHPELFQAAVCSAPLLDMIRYELFGLGATWKCEYGTLADPEQMKWLLAYSPAHNVRPGTDYPAVLFTVSEGDSRVDPMHARKLCAALQEASTGRRPILLRREGNVGHGSRALSREIELTADCLSFLGVQVGLRPREAGGLRRDPTEPGG